MPSVRSGSKKKWGSRDAPYSVEAVLLPIFNCYKVPNGSISKYMVYATSVTLPVRVWSAKKKSGSRDAPTG